MNVFFRRYFDYKKMAVTLLQNHFCSKNKRSTYGGSRIIVSETPGAISTGSIISSLNITFGNPRLVLLLVAGLSFLMIRVSEDILVKRINLSGFEKSSCIFNSARVFQRFV